MKTSYTIRLMRDADIAAMLAIYAPYVEDTAISFEYEVPSCSEYAERIQRIAARFPCIVCESGGSVIGFAYASEFRYRAAYQWCAESTVYIDRHFRGKGAGSDLYRALFNLLKRMHYTNVFAGVALPNEASKRLHLRTGFREIGVFEDIGYKQGSWHSTRWYQLRLGAVGTSPEPILSIQDLIAGKGHDEVNKLLQPINI